MAEETWNDFFIHVVDQFVGAHEHHFLVNFLVRLGEKYIGEERQVEFIFDLLMLKAENLLSGNKFYRVVVIIIVHIRTP